MKSASKRRCDGEYAGTKQNFLQSDLKDCLELLRVFAAEARLNILNTIGKLIAQSTEKKYKEQEIKKN